MLGVQFVVICWAGKSKDAVRTSITDCSTWGARPSLVHAKSLKWEQQSGPSAAVAVDAACGVAPARDFQVLRCLIYH